MGRIASRLAMTAAVEDASGRGQGVPQTRGSAKTSTARRFPRPCRPDVRTDAPAPPPE